jgi:hypothetical protein
MSKEQSSTSPIVRFAIVKPGYRVGDDGSVWSCVRKGDHREIVLTDEWHRLKPNPQRSGHLNVQLGKGDQRRVHRLVLEPFVGPCPEGMQCRHLDDDPANNRVDNLYWGTPKQNAADRARHGGYPKGEKAMHAVLTDADVLEALAMRAAGKRTGEIARWFGVGHTTIKQIFRGERWSHVTKLTPVGRRVD